MKLTIKIEGAAVGDLGDDDDDDGDGDDDDNVNYDDDGDDVDNSMWNWEADPSHRGLKTFLQS